MPSHQENRDRVRRERAQLEEAATHANDEVTDFQEFLVSAPDKLTTFRQEQLEQMRRNSEAVATKLNEKRDEERKATKQIDDDEACLTHIEDERKGLLAEVDKIDSDIKTLSH